MKNCLLLINVFCNSIFFFLYKQGKSGAISLASLARLSIFSKQKRNSLALKQSFSFQKNHDILYQTIKIIIFKFLNLENITNVYDYIDQNIATWNPWNINKEYLDTMENIRVNMQKETYRLVELIEMLTAKDRKQLIKKVISKLKTYQLSDSDKKYIQSIEEGYDKELKNEVENGK